MHKKIAWVTDSTAQIPENLLLQHDIFVIPLGILFYDQVYAEGVDLNTTELYDKIEHYKSIPTTSQPTIGQFVSLYEKLKESFDHIIAVHLSSELSGTYQTSLMAAQMVDHPIEVVDTRILSYPLTMMIEKGIHLAQTGMEPSQIADILRLEHKRFDNYILVGNLEQLYKGGRLNGVQLFLGSILKIKPVLCIRDGGVQLFGRFRTQRRALRTILNQLHAAKQQHVIRRIMILQADVMEEALQIKQTLLQSYKDIEIYIGPLSGTIGVHGGRGSLVIAWMREDSDSK
ncbi:DegV family protein [Hazenella sp. IB182353]|uniref:DegV family protein n=1 Tax=Polycladospora coralii TaxID=2771432 RepID=UPI001746675F|nr:DegV family protein [Polycladospora coralii]MBS7530808.1 DegV family protein [Polycladospora coralii]